MPTTVPHAGVAGTSLQGRMEATAEGGWRGNSQAGAEPRAGGIHLQQQQIPSWLCLLLPPLCCLYSANPALLQPFSLLKSCPRPCPSWRKTKGRSRPACQAAPRSSDALSPPLPPTSCTSAPLSASTSLTLRASSTFPWALEVVGPYELARAEQNRVYLCSSCLCFLPAAAAAFRTPGQAECPVSRKRCEGCA